MLPDRATLTESLCQVVRGLYARGWCLGASGDFSATLQQDPLRLLVTRARRDKRMLGPEDIVVVGADGHPAAGEHGMPSAKALVHATVAALTHAGAVLHTQSVWSTVLGERWRQAGGIAITGYEMLRGLEGIQSFDAEVFVPVIANSRNVHALAESASEQITEWPGSHGFLIAGGGLYSWGATIPDAARHAEVIEFLLECEGRKSLLGDVRSTWG